MRFQHCSIDCDFTISENIVNIIVIENAKVYRNMIFELKRQLNGYNGEFLIKKDNELLDIKKTIEYVDDVLDIDMNSRGILSKIYKLIEEDAFQNNYEEVVELQSHIQGFIYSVCEDFDIDYNLESQLSIKDILKSVKLSIEYVEEELLDNITKYMDIVNSLTGKTIFIFNNLKIMLVDSELSKLYDFTFKSKYNIITIERFNQENRHKNESVFILDSDLCEIF